MAFSCETVRVEQSRSTNGLASRNPRFPRSSFDRLRTNGKILTGSDREVICNHILSSQEAAFNISKINDLLDSKNIKDYIKL